MICLDSFAADFSLFSAYNFFLLRKATCPLRKYRIMCHGDTEVTENVRVDITESLNKITEKIIGCAIEVHRNLGPGLLESIYERALSYEFFDNNIKFDKQVLMTIIYKGHSLGDHRMDILVENEIIIELKAVNRIDPIFKAQLLSYLKISGKKSDY
jgi:GxxExxY protein